MNIVVYADESGSHIPKDESGHEVLVVCGFMDLVENWVKFIDEWNAVLKAHGADCFHFREIRYRNDETNQYTGWSDEQADDFIYDLAIVAGRSAISIASVHTAESLNRVCKGNKQQMFEDAFNNFFKAFEDVWSSHLKTHSEPVSFFFDRSDNREWRNAAHDVFHALSKNDARYGDIAFSDKKNPKTIALQAADLNAYRVRQVGAKAYVSGQGLVNKMEQRILDLVLSRNMFPPDHRLAFMQNASDDGIKRMVKIFRTHKKQQEEEWQGQGITGQIYYPLIHFPWDKLSDYDIRDTN